jgi:alkylhydroperoxidase/carboxymuconolactone decarboxylase family protein YurZ
VLRAIRHGLGVGTTSPSTPDTVILPASAEYFRRDRQISAAASEKRYHAARPRSVKELTSQTTKLDSQAGNQTTEGTAMAGASSDSPVLDTLAAITAESVARCGLDENSLLTARIAALVAVDAPASSYLLHVGPAVDAGVTVEQVQDILIAVAPIVGTPRTASAAAKITEALGIVIIALEEIEAEEGAQ